MEKDLHKQWFYVQGEIIFHASFLCIYKVLRNSAFRKRTFIWEILRKHCRSAKFGDIYTLQQEVSVVWKM